MPPNTNTQQQPSIYNPPPANPPVQQPSSSSPFEQIVDKIKAANNVLVTVSNDPSVDQLAACLGLTLALNKADKHGTAVFSGQVPSTIEFLKPEETIEQNTDSLRDFIISLDRSKADKLRYKLEDNFVKIFITPYKTRIGHEDLNFSQGDFNIDLIITLGIEQKEQLDAAIVAHGRILHDATIASINLTPSELGTINWTSPDASSLCEMVSDLVIKIDDKLLDQQISTALLTGLVAETDRFGNEKARPHTMSVSGVLMASGASTQLVSSKLEEAALKSKEAEEAEKAKVAAAAEAKAAEAEKPAEEIPLVVEEEVKLEAEKATKQPEQPEEVEEPQDKPEDKEDDGTIKIDHSLPPAPPTPKIDPEDQDDIHIDEEGKLQAIMEMKARQEAEKAESAKRQAEEAAAKAKPSTASDKSSEQKPFSPSPPPSGRGMMTGPPSFSGQLTANSVPEYKSYSPSTDPLSGNTKSGPLLDHNLSTSDEDKGQTLADLEKKVNSPHLGFGQPTSPSQAEQEKPATKETSKPAPDLPEPKKPEPSPIVPELEEVRSEVEKAANNPDFYRPKPPLASGAEDVDLNLKHDQSEEANESDNEEDKKDSPGPPPPVPPPMSPPSL